MLFLTDCMSDLVYKMYGTDTNICVGKGIANFERSRAGQITKELTEIEM